MITGDSGTQKVRETAEIVALGDSHSYGSKQYYYLLQTKALGLQPPMIICGLYVGHDFDNALPHHLLPEVLVLLEVRDVKRALAECSAQGYGRSRKED